MDTIPNKIKNDTLDSLLENLYKKYSLTKQYISTYSIDYYYEDFYNIISFNKIFKIDLVENRLVISIIDNIADIIRSFRYLELDTYFENVKDIFKDLLDYLFSTYQGEYSDIVTINKIYNELDYIENELLYKYNINYNCLILKCLGMPDKNINYLLISYKERLC